MEETRYRDAKEREFKVGDIVYNPFFGDYWIVGKYSDNEYLAEYEEDCPYYLAQYGDPDLYFMDLDEPSGFVIEQSIGEAKYDEYFNEINRIAKELQNFYKEDKNESMDNACGIK